MSGLLRSGLRARITLRRGDRDLLGSPNLRRTRARRFYFDLCNIHRCGAAAPHQPDDPPLYTGVMSTSSPGFRTPASNGPPRVRPRIHPRSVIAIKKLPTGSRKVCHGERPCIDEDHALAVCDGGAPFSHEDV
jgi:hypothetical protein